MTNSLLLFFLGIVSSAIGGILINWLSNKFYRKIRFSEILKAIDVLLVQLQKNYVPDYIVGVGRNGAIVASILSGHLGNRSILTISIQPEWAESNIRNTIVEASYMPSPKSLFNKKLLLVTCFVNSGLSIKVAYEHYKEITKKHPPSIIKTASIYTTVDPILKPDYFVYEVGKNFKMPIHKIIRLLPWMRSGWIHKA